MIEELSTIAVVVSDGKKSMEWFQSKLGFEAIDKEGHWLTVAPKGAKTLIHLCEMEPLEPGITGISFKVDNLDKTYEELKKKGVQFTHPPGDDGWGKYALFKDPDGNEFNLFE